MSEFSSALHVSSSGLRAQATRLRHISENIANADTPGYRRKTVPFETDPWSQHGTVKTGRLQLDQAALKSVFDPTHPLSNEAGFFEASNVELMVEIADAREAQRSYEANLKMFDQTRQMSSSLMELLKK